MDSNKDFARVQDAQLKVRFGGPGIDARAFQIQYTEKFTKNRGKRFGDDL